jgi:16S rRNA (guanine1207-N2)-methyltransferase
MPQTDTSIPYTQPRELAAKIGGRPVRLVTKPGFAGWDRVSGAQELLAAHVEAPVGASVALVGCGHGALAVALAAKIPDVRLTLGDPSVVALAMARRTLAAADVQGASFQERISLLPEQAGDFDAVVIETPQSRALARRWLLEAWELLRPGGALYLAGPNDQGIQSIVGDAGALFGGAQQLGYGGRARVARAVRGAARGAPGWAGELGVTPGTWYELELEVGGERLALRSLPGVFSATRLDDGTRLLVENLPPLEGKRVLDVGCGYGVIGIVAARRGAVAVDMVDASLLAVAAARANVRLHGLDQQANALPSDALAAVARRSYDMVLSNPPFHAGKAVDYDVARVFVEQARPLLGPGGRLALVANRFIRYDELMQGLFERVETLAQTRSYHVLAGVVGD